MCLAQPHLIASNGALEHDFGEVSQRQDLIYKVELKNEGDAPAHLKHIQKSCAACSPLRLGRELVNPGESSELTVRMNSGIKKGVHEEKVFVQTDDPKLTSGTLTISVKWTVKAFLECQPAAIGFGKKLYATTLDMPITVDAEGLATPVRVKEAKCSSPHIRIGAPQAQGARTIVPLSILPTAPAGKFGAEIAIETTSVREPRMIVPVTGYVVGAFEPAQRYINFGAVSQGKEVRRELKITQSDPRSQIVGADCDATLMKCQIRRQGNSLVLQADLLPSVKPGSHHTTVTLKTTCPVQKTIALPVLAVVR